jgi:hypothetical protein
MTPDVAELFTDIGIAQSTAPTAAAAQTSAALLWNIDIFILLWNILLLERGVN